ncbi:hypothetical protein CPB97_007383 [Podila verticillata]|nr:hypothetical protein CPB97_007383 [Podila verticillata]
MTGNHSSLNEEHFSGSGTGNLRSRHAASSSSSSASSSSTQTHHSNDNSRGTSTANRLHSPALQNEYSQAVQERHDQTLLDKDNNHSHLTGLDTSQSQTLTKASIAASSVETPTAHHSTVPTPTSSPPTTISQSESNLRDTLGDIPIIESEKRTGKQPEQDSEHGEFCCNICFDTSMSPVLTLCGHLFCWSCLHQWLEAQHQNPTCPVCKAGCAQDKVIPIYGRGKEQLDPRSTTPKRPAGQRPEPFRNPGQAGFAMAPGQVTFSGTMLPAFMFSPFGVQYGGSYTGTLGGNGAAQTPMQAYMSRMFFMLGTMILVGILLY